MFWWTKWVKGEIDHSPSTYRWMEGGGLDEAGFALRVRARNRTGAGGSGRNNALQLPAGFGLSLIRAEPSPSDPPPSLVDMVTGMSFASSRTFFVHHD